MMIRILFTWAIRHPASAYVQGINDLCAPLLLVFLSEYVIKADMAEHLLINQSQISSINSNHTQVKNGTEFGEMLKLSQ